VNAAISAQTPLGGNASIDEVNLPGELPTFRLFEGPGAPNPRTAMVHFVTPGWFAVYGTPLRAGRDIDDRDTKGSPNVVLVNEAFIRRFLPGQNAIGTTFSGLAKTSKTIVGIVGDAAYSSIRDDAPATMYAPLAQWDISSAPRSASISLRTSSGTPASVTRSLSAALTDVDRGLTFRFRPLRDQVDAALIQERVLAMLSAFFGALGLLLSGLGLYGVTSYVVVRRRAEIGIRMALGADRAGVVRLVLTRVGVLVRLGVLVGGSVSLWASKFVASLLSGVEPHDPITLTGAVLILATVSALAAWIPAYRAS
jgi:ABC-type antimicrobial peptide transport system permease subunit